MRRRTLLSASVLAITGCSTQAPRQSHQQAVELVAADPAKGFNFPYLLRHPAGSAADGRTFLLVEPNNSGHVSLDFKDHLQAAGSLILNGLGGQVARMLQLPLLMPVFPRGPDLYTHSLGRTTLNTVDARLRRLDHQLLAMISDGRARLSATGLPTSEKVLLTGFSASAMFVTRFAVLHPGAVQAVAAGGLNSFVILPVTSLQGEPLAFHLGVRDVAAYTGEPFQASVWNRIPQYLFMGAEDANDAVLFDDSYAPEDRDLVFRLVGRDMPRRWEACRQIYANAGAPAVFVTYPGLGHGTNGSVHTDVAAFIAARMVRNGA